MKKTLVSLLCLFLLTFDVFANSSEKVISDFLSRILGQQPILTVLDESLGQQSDIFIQNRNYQLLTVDH